ncbi:DedA family protein, putative [hydrothermal vent metagenome]|uniref:DedA family protein, putative n=1 Tax=hydrothermal vent metagenome TaxID=652676 RepID=A0A3B0QNF8_9ZZZZ
MKKDTLRLVVLLALVSVFAVVIRTNPGAVELSAERLTTYIDGLGMLGPIVFILIFTVAPTLLLPALPLTITGGLLFGPFWGVVYVSIGSTSGATLAFLVARLLGRKWAKKILKKSGLRSLDKRVKKDGWKIVAITRLIPLFPYNLLNYAFGLSGIGLKTYVITSFIFMLPATIAYVTFSSSIPDIARGRVSWQLIAGLGLIAVLSVATLIYKKRKTDLH